MKIPKFKLKLPHANIKINKELTLKIIHILSLLFAIAAIILSILLYNKRKELFDANNQMSAAIAIASKNLDKESGTNISAKVTVDAVKQSYNNSSTLAVFQKQASDIIAQRNTLSNTLAQISSSIPSTEKLNTSNFSDIKSYNSSVAALLNAASETEKLLKLLPEQLISLANSLNIQLKDEQNIKKSPTPSDYLKVFSELSAKASALNKELASTQKELALRNAEIDKIKIELNKYSDIANDYKIMIKTKENQNQALSQKTKSLNQELDYYKNQIKKLSSSQNKKKNDKINMNYNELLQQVHGEVLKYDAKWGNAIINIGKNFKVKTKVDNKEKVVTVSIPVDSELIIARNNQFIARVKVKEVFDDYSLTTLSFPTNAKLEPGDIVFFPSNSNYSANGQSNNNKEDNYKDKNNQKKQKSTEPSIPGK